MMYPDDVGPIIATRELYLADQPESENKIEVLIGQPQAFPDGVSFFCPFQVRGVGSEKIFIAAGVDQVQALQLVMFHIHSVLESMDLELGGRLRWEGSHEKGFGFPEAVGP